MWRRPRGGIGHNNGLFADVAKFVIRKIKRCDIDILPQPYEPALWVELDISDMAEDTPRLSFCG
jgi:hypothetical protein